MLNLLHFKLFLSTFHFLLLLAFNLCCCFYQVHLIIFIGQLNLCHLLDRKLLLCCCFCAHISFLLYIKKEMFEENFRIFSRTELLSFLFILFLCCGHTIIFVVTVSFVCCYCVNLLKLDEYLI